MFFYIFYFIGVGRYKIIVHDTDMKNFSCI
jgi:hypothetical protein